MKAVFLDFDGVLNTLRDPELPKEDVPEHGSAQWCAVQLSEERVRRLNRLFKDPEVCCVLSTSWREAHPMEKLDTALKLQGFQGRVMGCTPTLKSGEEGYKVCRHDEIKLWVQIMRPSAYVILDDMDMGSLNDHLVKTEDGLEDHHIDRALEILNE